MTVRYIENRYKVEDQVIIYDTKLVKNVCFCFTNEVAQHIAMLLNEEPVGLNYGRIV